MQNAVPLFPMQYCISNTTVKIQGNYISSLGVAGLTELARYLVREDVRNNITTLRLGFVQSNFTQFIESTHMAA